MLNWSASPKKMKEKEKKNQTAALDKRSLEFILYVNITSLVY